jgi:adenosine kinase
MARAAELPILDGDPAAIAYVIISPNDPAAMARYARECREKGVPFIYDPSQQVTRLSAGDLIDGMEGASVLICNDYEWGMILQKTGFDEAAVLARVATLIVTHGSEGSTIHARSGAIAIPPARLHEPAVDPTGVGDAYRSGLLKGMLREDPWELCGRLASVAAAFCLESVGPQPPRMSPADFLERFRESYGDAPQLSGLFDPVPA